MLAEAGLDAAAQELHRGSHGEVEALVDDSDRVDRASRDRLARADPSPTHITADVFLEPQRRALEVCRASTSCGNVMDAVDGP